MHTKIPDSYSKREGGKYFLSGYVLLEYNLTGFVNCSHISGLLVRLRFLGSFTLISIRRNQGSGGHNNFPSSALAGLFISVLHMDKSSVIEK